MSGCRRMEASCPPVWPRARPISVPGAAGSAAPLRPWSSVWRVSHSTSTPRRHSPVPGPCAPAAAITPACAVTVPTGSSTRDLLTSGSPVGEAEAAVGGAVLVAAGSSGPTSHTRVTTTGVDELAWAARSCRGLVRARVERERVTLGSWADQRCHARAGRERRGARSPACLAPPGTASGQLPGRAPPGPHHAGPPTLCPLFRLLPCQDPPGHPDGSHITPAGRALGLGAPPPPARCQVPSHPSDSAPARCSLGAALASNPSPDPE